jgi:predicted DNA-binding transcriptional regulator AlpA
VAVTTAADTTIESPKPLADHVPARRLIDVEDVAHLLGMSPRSVFRNADAGLIPWGLKIGSLRRWDAAEIDAFIAGGCKPPKRSRAGRQS